MQLFANSVEQVFGGNVIKEGDETPLGFKFRNEDGSTTDLTGSNVSLKIANYQGVVLEKTATVNADNSITFYLSKDDVTGHGNMRLEFTVTYNDGSKEKFPANGWQEIKITPTLDNLNVGGVAVVTVEEIKAEYQSQIDTFKSEVNTKIKNVDQSTTNANSSADYANQQGTYAKNQGDFANNKAAELEKRVNDSIATTTNSQEIIDARGTYTVLKNRLDSYDAKLSKQDKTKQALNQGVNIINATETTPLDFQIEGNTLVNLLGRDGNFETDKNADGVADGWAKGGSGASTTFYSLVDSYKYDYKSQRLTSTSNDTSNSRAIISDITLKLSAGKYYIGLVDFNTDGSKGLFRLLSTNLSTVLAGSDVQTTSKTLFFKYSPTTDIDAKVLAFNSNDLGVVGYVEFDGVRIYEVTVEEYNNIGTLWNENELARRYPYVDDMKHLQNPIVTVEGENLLPPFYEWTLHANAKALSPYELELNASGIDQYSHVVINVNPNTSYYLDVSGNGIIVVYEWIGSAHGLYLKTPTTKFFTTGSNTKQIKVYVSNGGSGTGKFTFSNPILTLGSTAKPFVPRNPSHLYAEVKLGKVGKSKDTLYQENGRWKVRKEVEKDVVLNGLLGWSLNSDQTGYKVFKLAKGTLNNNGIVASDLTKAIKYNGIVMANILSQTTFDQFSADKNWAGADLVFSVSDSDTGFGETYTPTTDEIKAYFNGWKVKTVDANNKPTAWTNIVTGADAPTQTLAYVSTTRATGYTAYKLSYVLATPQIVDVTDKVEGALTVNDLTQLTLDSGVIVREKVVPVYPSYGDRTYINWKDGASSNILKYKTEKILSVFRNHINDNNWTFENSSVANGKQRAYILNQNFDTTAEYTVTYLVLDKQKFSNNPINTRALYNTSLKSSFDDLVNVVADNVANTSVNIRAIAELYKRVKALGG